MREEKRRKENLNKKIDSFINHIFYNQTLAEFTLKEAKENILSFKTKFKTAQEEGTLSPEETQNMNMEILVLVEQVAEIASDVIEGVPATNGEGVDPEPTSNDTTIEEGGNHELDKRINQGKNDDKKKDKQVEDEITKLNTKVATMEKEAKQKELATEYAKHFPVAQREGKQKEFAKSTDSLPILEARLKEVKAFFKNPLVIKEAALQDDTFEITAMPGNNSGKLDFGGKF